MAGRPSRRSIFSQNLDHVAFFAYLLGAVVPLIALGVVVDRFVLPDIEDRNATLGLIGALVSIAVLSFASFLTLRRTTRESLERIDRDNRRLSGLLEASRGLGEFEHSTDALEAAAIAALPLTGARAAYVFQRGEPGTSPHCVALAGEDAEKRLESLVEPLVEVARLVMSEERPACRGGVPAMLGAPLAGQTTAVGAIVTVDGATDAHGESTALEALSGLAGLCGVALHNTDLREAQRNFFVHVTDLLVTALDAQRGYHEGHGTRVAEFANRIGRTLELDEHRLQRLHFAALLHDIGMLKLDPSQQLNPRKCAKHPLIGARMLGRIRLWEQVAPVVKHHHEWWNGSGTPEGLSGEAIPLESRIVAVCDTFDALVRESAGDAAMANAVREIESGAGTQFDPQVVVALRAVADSGALRSE